MKVENAAFGTVSVSPQAIGAHCHQICHHLEVDKAGDILMDKEVKC